MFFGRIFQAFTLNFASLCHPSHKHQQQPPSTPTSTAPQGLVTCLIGATYVHMERLFDVSSNTMSLSLTGCFFGSLLGAGVCALLYHRVNPELLMAFNCAGAGLVTIAAYRSPGILWYVACMTLQGIFLGVLSAGE